MVKGKNGKPDQIVYSDGAEQPLSNIERVEEIDFLALCQTRFGKRGTATQKPGMNEEREDPLRDLLERISEPPLFMAAWLYRRGHRRLAGRALAASDNVDQKTAVKTLRDQFAGTACYEMSVAFSEYADDLALARAEWLLERYPDAQAEIVSQAKTAVADLKRRKQKGTFGRAPDDKWPADFGSWDTAKKTRFSIDRLEELESVCRVRNGTSFEDLPAVAALIELGDAAVPSLIDTIEKDNRLCRTFDNGRWGGRKIVGVRDAALDVVQLILRVGEWDPRNATDAGLLEDYDKNKRVRVLRSYWKEFGHLRYEERLMKVLKDPKSTPEATRDAAKLLSHLADDPPSRSHSLSSIGRQFSTQIDLAAYRFESPTAAEAILAAYDRDQLASNMKRLNVHLHHYLNPFEDAYLEALIELGDRRIAGELTKRASAAPDLAARRKWAFAAHQLGDSRALKALANDIRLGYFALPSMNQDDNPFEREAPDALEMQSLIRTFANAGRPETERALAAMTNPNHPAHELLKHFILESLVRGNDCWSEHPCCLPFLRMLMDDKRATGASISIEYDQLRRRGEQGSSSRPLPPCLKNSDVCRTEVYERVCGAAALQMSELIAGLPAYHPLFKDADRRLQILKTAFDRFPDKFVRAPDNVAALFTQWRSGPIFIPAIGPLDHVATAEDVRKGRAIFHLEGKRKLLLEPLPMRAMLASNDGPAQPVLVVQAEADDKGTIFYGVIGAHQIAKVRENEITQLGPLEENQ